MYGKIAAQIDAIATAIEEKGLVKEAGELDIVANTLEKLAYSVKTDPGYKQLQIALDNMKQGRSPKGNLQSFKLSALERLKAFMTDPNVQKMVAHFNKALNFADKDDFNSAMPHITETMNFMEKAEPAIRRGYVNGLPEPEKGPQTNTPENVKTDPAQFNRIRQKIQKGDDLTPGEMALYNRTYKPASTK